MSRLLLPSSSLASVELEVLHDAAEVSPYVPLVSPKQLLAVITSPRLFVDRTGLHIKPVHSARYFPDFGGYSLLGDSAVNPYIPTSIYMYIYIYLCIYYINICTYIYAYVYAYVVRIYIYIYVCIYV